MIRLLRGVLAEVRRLDAIGRDLSCPGGPDWVDACCGELVLPAPAEVDRAA